MENKRNNINIMSWFQEVRPSFLVTRVYGLTPYSFAKGVPSKSRVFLIFSYVISLIRFCDCFFRIYQHLTIHASLQLKILKVFRTLLTTSAHVTEGICSIRSTNVLKKLINDINEYDRALGIKFATKSIVQRTWFTFAFITCYLVTMWTLRPAEIVQSQLFNLYYALRGVGWFSMTLKFITVMFSLKRRFQYLHDILIKGTPRIVENGNNAYISVRLKDVGRLHDKLISVAKKFNSMHNMVLVMWIGESSLTLTLEIYYYLNDDASQTYAKFWPTFISVLPYLLLLVCIFTICHDTAVVANKVGWIALYPTSYVSRGRFVLEKDENFIVAQSFILHSLRFEAAYGLFSIELPLLGTIFGAMTTVLVFLCG